MHKLRLHRVVGFGLCRIVRGFGRELRAGNELRPNMMKIGYMKELRVSYENLPDFASLSGCVFLGGTTQDFAGCKLRFLLRV